MVLRAHFTGRLTTETGEGPDRSVVSIYRVLSRRKSNSQRYYLALDLSNREERPLFWHSLVWHALATYKDGSRTYVGRPADFVVCHDVGI